MNRTLRRARRRAIEYGRLLAVMLPVLAIWAGSSVMLSYGHNPIAHVIQDRVIDPVFDEIRDFAWKHFRIRINDPR